MERRSIKDLSSAIALAAFGLYVTIEAARFSYLTEDGPGPGFLPLWLGIAICSLSLCLIVVNQLRPAAKPLGRERDWSSSGRKPEGRRLVE